MWNDHDITPAVLLSHMQVMQRTLTEKIDKLDQRMNGFDGRMDRLENRMERGFATLTMQIDGIDRRLDAIEIEKLPERVRKLEVAMTKPG